MAENKLFEFSPQVRELAEKNIDQARKFYDQWMEGISQVMNMWSATPAGEMMPGFDGLRERAIGPSQGCARFDDASEPLRASADEILCHSSARARTTDDSGHAKTCSHLSSEAVLDVMQLPLRSAWLEAIRNSAKLPRTAGWVV